MRTYLKDTFSFNDIMNKKLLARFQDLTDPSECIRLFSHLVNCQFKWLDRIKRYPGKSELDWWQPRYAPGDLAAAWEKSLQLWMDFLDTCTEIQLQEDVHWVGSDDAVWTTRCMDIPLQLNYHSIHHRAQMQTIFRAQGLVPDFVDYIGIRYRRLEPK